MSQQRPLISNGCSIGLVASYVERIMSVYYTQDFHLHHVFRKSCDLFDLVPPHYNQQRLPLLEESYPAAGTLCFIHTSRWSLREKQLSRQKQSISAWSMFLVEICKQDNLIGQNGVYDIWSPGKIQKECIIYYWYVVDQPWHTFDVLLGFNHTIWSACPQISI